ncbi:MAG: hypothetical protein NZ822_03370, partial [Patescibacteria group bacterium]|nr:hypothetical protein [Patescibacteria group bacterium]
DQVTIRNDGLTNYQNANVITSWKPLTIISGTTNKLNRDGIITWNIPEDWKEGYTELGGAPYRYWIRIRITATPTHPVMIKSASNEYRQLIQREIYGHRYMVRMPGWDPQNDRNNDGYVDDNEFANLVNPKATARYKWHSRVGHMGWAGVLDHPVNFNKRELWEIYKDHYENDILAGNEDRLNGIYSDSFIVSNPLRDMANKIKLLEPKEDIDNWEKAWNEIHGYLRDSWK